MGTMLLPWWLLFPTMFGMVWLGARRWLLLPLGIGLILALFVQQLDWCAGMAIGLLGLAAAAVQPQRPRAARLAGHCLFVSMAVVMYAHLAPGFHNPLVLDTRFSAEAVPYRMYLNLDKLLLAVWLMYAWRQTGREPPRLTAVRIGLAGGVVAGAGCTALAWAFGLIAWQPDWPAMGWLWALNNLLLVCVVEELLFRGFIQDGLTQMWARWQHGAVAALLLTAALFGMAHLAAGGVYVVIAAIAGLVYGVAYQRGGLRAAVLAHFTLNLLHFTLFTYPLIAQ